jgi:hypothetical protein
MSKVFRGTVSVVQNTKGEIALKRDVDGQFSADNSVECNKLMHEFAKKLKAPINKYSYWVPEGVDLKTAVPVLMADRFGNPRMTMLAPVTVTEAGKPAAKVTKLA